MNPPKLTPEHLLRAAIVYVRQSTPTQVTHHLESQRRQYALEDRARELGFPRITVIDEDLGRTDQGWPIVPDSNAWWPKFAPAKWAQSSA